MQVLVCTAEPSDLPPQAKKQSDPQKKVGRLGTLFVVLVVCVALVALAIVILQPTPPAQTSGAGRGSVFGAGFGAGSTAPTYGTIRR